MGVVLGKHLKEVRVRAGISQAELARRMGVSPAMISQYETGARSPKMDTLKKIADALGVHASELGVEYYHADNYGELLPDQIELLNAFDDLNLQGQVIAIERVKELTEIPRYKR